jgi:hypothetical protein
MKQTSRRLRQLRPWLELLAVLTLMGGLGAFAVYVAIQG